MANFSNVFFIYFFWKISSFFLIAKKEGLEKYFQNFVGKKKELENLLEISKKGFYTNLKNREKRS